jgi:FkbM family methyltransferase
MKLSYAQRLEDYHLACALGGQTSGFYVDIGAGHPVADNVSYWFYLEGWRGLVVEPQEALFERYRLLRPRDVAVCSLIGREIGDTDFHVIDTLHGLSTTVRDNALEAARLGATYRTVRRPVTTLARLFGEHEVERVDFLKIDVEGAEADVLAGADWDRWRPRIVVAEAIAPNSAHDASQEWEAALLARNYRFTLFDGLNRFYVAAEEADLLARMPREPAPWGAVRHLYEFGRAPDNPGHPDHALARGLAARFLASLPIQSEGSLVSLLQSLGSEPAGGGLRGFPGTGSADFDLTSEEACRALVRTDGFRAALGRIAAPYDGGLMLDDEPALPDQGAADA